MKSSCDKVTNRKCRIDFVQRVRGLGKDNALVGECKIEIDNSVFNSSLRLVAMESQTR